MRGALRPLYVALHAQVEMLQQAAAEMLPYKRLQSKARRHVRHPRLHHASLHMLLTVLRSLLQVSCCCCSFLFFFFLFFSFYFIGFSSVNIFSIHYFKLATVDSAKKRRINPLISIAVHIC